jgi:hypothetical protein
MILAGFGNYRLGDPNLNNPSRTAPARHLARLIGQLNLFPNTSLHTSMGMSLAGNATTGYEAPVLAGIGGQLWRVNYG